MNPERGAGVDLEVIGGEKKSVHESIVASLHAEFEMPVLQAHAEIMFGTVPCFQIDREIISERVGCAGVGAIGAKPHGGEIEAPLGDEFDSQRALKLGRSLGEHGMLSKRYCLLPDGWLVKRARWTT